MTRIERIAIVLGHLSPERFKELVDWEAENLDGHRVGTVDWPGWNEAIAEAELRMGLH